MSAAYSQIYVRAVKKIREYGISLGYDPDPAIRIVVDWEHNRVNYAGQTGGHSVKGKANTCRFAATYYF